MQKLRIEERVEGGLAHHPFDSAQALHLLGRQTQARHFEILSAETYDRVANCCHRGDLSENDQKIRCAVAGKLEGEQ